MLVECVHGHARELQFALRRWTCRHLVAAYPTSCMAKTWKAGMESVSVIDMDMVVDWSGRAVADDPE